MSFYRIDITNVFQIWSKLAGSQELAGGFVPAESEKYFELTINE